MLTLGIAVNEIQRTLGDVPVRSPRWTNYPRGPGLGDVPNDFEAGYDLRYTPVRQGWYVGYPVTGGGYESMNRCPSMGLGDDAVHTFAVGDHVRMGGDPNTIWTIQSIYTGAGSSGLQVADLLATACLPGSSCSPQVSIPLTQLSAVPAALVPTAAPGVSTAWKTAAIVSGVVAAAALGFIGVRAVMKGRR